MLSTWQQLSLASKIKSLRSPCQTLVGPCSLLVRVQPRSEVTMPGVTIIWWLVEQFWEIRSTELIPTSRPVDQMARTPEQIHVDDGYQRRQLSSMQRHSLPGMDCPRLI